MQNGNFTLITEILLYDALLRMHHCWMGKSCFPSVLVPVGVHTEALKSCKAHMAKAMDPSLRYL